MCKLTRRKFLGLGGTVLAATSVAGVAPFAIGGARKTVVVVGGGIGGATAAKYLRMMDPSIDVTLIEANTNYYTCFMSNEVLAGERSMESIRFGYSGLKGHGIHVVQDRATSIDPDKRVVRTQGGQRFAYDRCIVSPGVDFRWDSIEGYDARVAERIPHAWKAGPQTLILRNQLRAMRDGGTVLIAPPANPYRCPPAPYDRVSQIAHYLKRHKPRSKIIILDPKDRFSKFDLFLDGWKRYYGYGTDDSMITWVSGAAGGTIESLDVKAMTIQADIESFKGDVINIIPPQKAGWIAFSAGLTNEQGWCPVDFRTFESTIQRKIHVIGDSSQASPMPKGGYVANTTAKVCAAAIVADFNGGKAPRPSWINSCYSTLAPGDAISAVTIYTYRDGRIVKVEGSGGLTPQEFDAGMRAREAQYAHSWFNNITADVFD
ncbi:NAD(P)/FAD-dependent oxidoreductase [Thiolapillus brandeum]|uniref:Flavocytochrome c sulphide dehydrogenase flavoprotein subunit n=1 Tax=Thiolapillus brandeum TaxID=1076588 RepID=A0A7U6GJX6_9GAMM|nr:NAD(P)/FAD-dependent oxidoreductase [Thiolapillus brandeum]BAO45011.1 flavocytochrome c sulphide dehydrogenase flavoprotein subunit [Thiolapillus brandeum]